MWTSEKNLSLKSIIKKVKNCVKLSKIFEIFNFNSMRKLFYTYYPN